MIQQSPISSWFSLVFAKSSVNSNRRIREFLLLLSISAVLMLSTGADDGNATRYNNLGYRLMCGCGCHDGLLECRHRPADNRGSSLGKGPCEVALRMRDELKAAIQKGKTDDAILSAFVQTYGNNVLLDSRARPAGLKNTNKLDWLIPFAGLVATLSIVVVLFNRRQLHRANATAEPKLPSADVEDLRQRIRRETERDDYGRPFP